MRTSTLHPARAPRSRAVTARAVYIASGGLEVDGRRFDAGQMLVVDGSASRVTATEQSTVMLLGGEPVGQRYIYWNFVSSSQERLAQAAADWKAGRMKLPHTDNAEFIPLPDEPVPPAPPMS
jgi:redox-sensitive bicupin YhaK (pirin superfamily)